MTGEPVYALLYDDGDFYESLRLDGIYSSHDAAYAAAEAAVLADERRITDETTDDDGTEICFGFRRYLICRYTLDAPEETP